jgi:hypothetical protein
VASPRLLCLIDNTYWITNDDRWEVNNGDFLNYFRVFLQPQRPAKGQLRVLLAKPASNCPAAFFAANLSSLLGVTLRKTFSPLSKNRIYKYPPHKMY